MTEATGHRQIQLLPSLWVEHLPNRWVNPAELYHAVRDSDLVRRQATLVGAKQAEISLASSTLDPIHAEALSGVRIRIRDTEYRIAYHFDPHHVEGQGGLLVRETTLLRGDLAVLKSVVTVSYTTYADDSEDHEIPSSRSEDTYLLEPDELAEAVFRLLKESVART